MNKRLAKIKMAYKLCPQCGKNNHHNKVSCAKCGLRLRAGKLGRPKAARKSEKKVRCQLVVPVSKWMWCVPPVMIFARQDKAKQGKVNKCTICEQNLVDEAGRPVKSTTPCSSCGHLNEVKRTCCSVSLPRVVGL